LRAARHPLALCLHPCQAHTAESLRAILKDFEAEAVRDLLFLRSVECVELLEWLPGADAPVLRFSVAAENASALRNDRAAFTRFTAASDGSKLMHSSYRITFRRTRMDGAGGVPEVSLESYLISQALGGGRSAMLAAAGASQYGMRLVPWAAVAARIADATLTPEEGFAFCFLPLPVRTGLPVHVNAFFELSSNRRDVWFGDDLAGAGKMRSDWNACLLQDVAAPAYARLLEAAAAIPGAQPVSVYALWPAAVPREPWAGCVRGAFACLPSLRVLHTAARGGMWVAPQDALFPDAAVESSADLLAAHVEEQLLVVTPPQALRKLMRDLAPAGAPATTSPTRLRDALRRSGAHPAIERSTVALACLQYCLSDLAELGQDAAAALNGVKLLPVADGSMAAFALSKPGMRTVFVTSELESSLLESAPQLCVDRSIGELLLESLMAVAIAGDLNLRPVTTAALAEALIQHILPVSWRDAREVAWTPGVSGHPTLDRYKLLWRRLQLCESLEPFAAWPILATSDSVALPAVRGAPVLMHGSATLAAPAQQALLRAGVRVLHAGVEPQHAQLGSYVYASTPLGVLDALHSAAAKRAGDASGTAPVLSKPLEAAPAEERRALAALLLQPKVLSSTQPEVQRDLRLRTLRALPIFETHGAEPSFTALHESTLFLPPPKVDAALLSASYVAAATADAATALLSLGVARRSRAHFFRDDLLRRWSLLPAAQRSSAALTLLRDLPSLCAEERGFADSVASCAFVPTASGEDKAPASLYDKRVPELATLLDPTTCFPAPPFDAPELAAPLAALGMSRTVTPDALLDAARCVEAMAARGEAAAAQERGAALFRYLELDQGRLLDPDAGKPFAGLVGFISADARAARASALATRDAFLAQLRDIAWCPVLSTPPEEGLPWPDAAPAVASPAAARPRADAWLVSAAASLLACECRSGKLAELMCWAAPPSVAQLAAQLVALGKQHATVSSTALAQALSAAVPRLYTHLGDARRAPGFAAAVETMRAERVLWVGAGFAPPADVAFTGPLNLAPYLHVLPADLVCFRGVLTVLGVRDAFGPADYTNVLTRLAADAGDAALTPQQLELSVWLLQQLLAEAWRPPHDAPLYAPGADGVLRPASALTHNDAPWLGAPAPGIVLSHPLLSQAVADAVGVRSMRGILLADSAASLDLGMASAEAFGQHEALTTRLRHITDQYADGPGILSELIQNADDAGATEVSFMLDETQYGTRSVLGGRMAEWQGPALLCYSNSTFKPADFVAISRIGQDSKVDKPAAAGRFGLGFNSTYHLSDVPTFVSGDFLVMFDPHHCNVPGTSAAHPGLRIKFAGGTLRQNFPDQCAPLCFFGCTMSESFNGTLFRFPLRTDATAARSEIKQEPYSPAAAMSLLASFREGATRTLLFLKNVRRVNCMVLSPGDTQPRLLFAASLDSPGADPRQPAIAFLSGAGNGAVMNKKQFNAYLSRMPEAQLPLAAGVVHVQVHDGDAGDSPPERWLVCSAIGGGRARAMAVDDVSGRGLVPWAGVAARLPSKDDSTEDALRGRAFCFLPLPVHTGLPVHVNAYFELSSNRRDLWSGEDMVGGGKKRSEWNTALLEDVVAPVYARLLAEAAQLLGPVAAYYALFPSGALREPWACLVRRVFSCLVPLPVLHNGGAGCWVAPRDAVLPDHTPAAGPALQAALVVEGVPLAAGTPPAICDGFASVQPPGRLRFLAPALVRELLRKPGAHPALLQRDAVHALLSYALSDTIDDDAGSTRELVGVPLLPLADGSLARFAAPAKGATVFHVTTELEAVLLSPVAALLADRGVPAPLHARLEALADGATLNLRRVDTASLATLLQGLLPREWRAKADVPWTPGAPGQPDALQLRRLWQRLALCDSLDLFAPWPLLPTCAADGGLVLVPVRPGCGVLVHDSWSENLSAALHATGCRLLAPGFPEIHHPQLGACVHEASCTGVLDAIRGDADADAGLADSLRASMARTSDAERGELRAYLLQSRWHDARTPLSAAQLATLRALPIFETHAPSGDTRFVALADGPRQLPPAGAAVAPALLDGNILRVGGAREAAMLTAVLGVTPAPRAAFYRAQALERVAEFAPAARDELFLAMLHDLPSLAAEDAGFVEALAATAFVPVAPAAGAVTPEPRRACRLYDPRVADVAALLHGCAFFPAPPFASFAALDALVALGLRRTLGAQGVLDAARAAQAAAAADAETGAARGAALLRYLDAVGCAAASEGAPDEDAFWATLASIPWCPVLAEPPSPCLPWPVAAMPPRLAAPRACRPVADAWLVSACCSLVDGRVKSAHLAQRLGWAAPPPASVLAAQLLDIAKQHAYLLGEAAAEAEAHAGDADSEQAAPSSLPAAAAAAQFAAEWDAAAPVLYGALAGLSGERDAAVLAAQLDGAPCVWTAAGFVAASTVAFDAAPSYSPYINAPPPRIPPALLLALGARETLQAGDFAAALRQLASEHGAAPLPPDLLQLAAEFAERCAELQPPPVAGAAAPTGIYLPDAVGVMAPAAELLFNDAAWLAGGGGDELRLVHPLVPNAAAERLGSRSLRYIFLVDTELTDRLACPPAAALAKLLAGYDDAICMLLDILDVADCAGATGVTFTLDERQHGRTSLLTPALAAFQGPALLVRLEGAALGEEELCGLLAAAPPARVRGRVARFANGLTGLFHVTDLPCAVSGDKMYIFDPSGAVLGGGPGEADAGPRGGPVGKAFTFVGSDLPRRFPHSFAAFPGCDFAAPVPHTLLRLPLRTARAQSPLGRPECTPEAMRVLLRSLAADGGERALLFTASLLRLRVTEWAADAVAPAAEPMLDASVTACDAAARALVDDKEWRRSSLAAIFTSGAPGAKRVAPLTLTHRRNGGPAVVDQFVVAAVLGGSSRARDAALDRRSLGSSLLPLAAAAAHVSRDGASVDPVAAPQRGLFAPMPLAGDASALAQLPFALMGCFALARAGGRRLHPPAPGDPGTPAARQAVAAMAPAVAAEVAKAGWNRELLTVAAAAAADLLTELARMASRNPTDARWHYALWPRRAALASCPDAATVVECLLKPLYATLAERPLLRLRDGSCVRAADGIFLPPGGSAAEGRPRAQAFLAAHHPVVDAPPELRAEFEAAGVRDVRELTPAAMRKLLRGAPPRGAAAQGEEAVETQIELLDVCFSDLLAPVQPASADNAAATPAVSAATALGVVPGSTAAGLAALIDSAGLIDAQTLRSLPAMLPAGMSESAQQLLDDAGLGAATVVSPSAPGAPPLHASRLRELQGVLFPTADAKLVPFGSDVLVGAPGITRLLPAAAGRLAHPRCSEAHGLFFSHPGFQTALGLKPLTLPRLARELPAALPPRCVNAAAPAVPWDGSAPDAAWVASFWRHVADAAPAEAPPGRRGAQMDAFSPFALLPTLQGELVRVGLREMVFVPPQGAPPTPTAEETRAAAAMFATPPMPMQETPEQLQQQVDSGRMAAAFAAVAALAAGVMNNAGARTLRELWPALQPMLLRLRAPVLDAARFPRAASLVGATHSPPPGPLRTPADEVAWRLRCAVQRGGPGRLDWAALLPSDRDSLFELFSASHSQAGWLGAPEGHAFLRTLPIFATHAGLHTALDGTGSGGASYVTCTPESLAFVGAAAGGDVQVLAHRPAAHAFYAALGVPELTDADALARLVLPRFGALDAAGRGAALEYARRHWTRLRNNAGLKDALRTTPFVRPGTWPPTPGDSAPASLKRPGELLDPRNETLVAAFRGEAAFPAHEWAAPEWLPLLRDCGLTNALDAPAAMAAATALESRAAAARGAGDAARSLGNADVAAAADASFDAAYAAAEALASHVIARVAAAAGPTSAGGGYTTAVCGELSRVAFVPATRGAPGAAGTRCLARLSEAALPTDWPLAWAAAPVLAPEAVPPPAARGRLGVRSPPAFATFAAHLHAAGAGGGEAALAAWPPQAGPPDVAFATALAHLGAIWPDLSPTETQRLRGARCVLVANAQRLVAPDRLFMRCRVDLAPLAYELPAALTQHAAVMRALGARDEPSADDALALLRAAASAAALNPDELRAALRAARLAADTARPGTPAAAAVASGAVPVPDAAGRLRPARECVHAGAASPWLRRHVAPDAIRAVHPALAADAALCAALRVPSLDAVVIEALAQDDDGDALPCEALVASPPGAAPALALADAAARLREPALAAAAQAALRAAAAAAGAPAPVPSAAADALAAASSQLAFARRLRTRLLLLPGRADVTRGGAAAPALERPHFIDVATKRLLVAQPAPHVAPAAALAAALSAAMGASAPLPLAPLLACSAAELPALARRCVADCGYDSGDDGGIDAAATAAAAAACEPGVPVSPAHAALLQLQPQRPLCAGETVAWRPPAPPPPPAAEAASAAALARAEGRPPPSQAAPQPVYARVAADARPSPGETLFRVAVDTGGAELRHVLSSELLSFRAVASAAFADGDVDAPDAAVDPASSGAQLAADAPANAQPAAVSPAEAAAAVRQLLEAADVPVDLERGAMLEQLLTLQAELRASRQAAETAAATAASATGNADVLSRSLLCPITQTALEDPVICTDGHTCAFAFLCLTCCCIAR
jgi:sacsin